MRAAPAIVLNERDAANLLHMHLILFGAARALGLYPSSRRIMDRCGVDRLGQKVKAFDMWHRPVIALTYGTISAALSAASGAACSAAGSGILAAAHHDGYHAAQQAACGAVGSAVLNGGASLLLGLAVPEFVMNKVSGENRSSLVPGSDLISTVGGAVLGGMTGAAILRSAGHTLIPSTSAAAAASAVGAAVLCGGGLVLSLLVCRPTAQVLSPV